MNLCEGKIIVAACAVNGYAVRRRDFDTVGETFHANGKCAVGMSSKRAPLQMKVTNILEETI